MTVFLHTHTHTHTHIHTPLRTRIHPPVYLLQLSYTSSQPVDTIYYLLPNSTFNSEINNDIDSSSDILYNIKFNNVSNSVVNSIPDSILNSASKRSLNSVFNSVFNNIPSMNLLYCPMSYSIEFSLNKVYMQCCSSQWVYVYGITIVEGMKGRWY